MRFKAEMVYREWKKNSMKMAVRNKQILDSHIDSIGYKSCPRLEVLLRK